MTATARHSGNIGDVFASFPALREFTRKTGKKIILYLVLDQKAHYYKDAVHPIKNDNGEDVMLNKRMFDFSKSFILNQSFIEDVREWEGEFVDINLDIIRETFVGMPNSSINRWYFYIYPDLACDLSMVWMNAPSFPSVDFAKNKIIINRTERYTNPTINYRFLKDYEGSILFSGVERERNIFCEQYNLNIPMLEASSFLEVAQAILQSKFFIGNQSSAFQIAEGLKHPRILETCYFATNVTPIGNDAFDFFGQAGLEYYVKYLFNKY